ncbi:serine hydrolase [Jeotgalibacillus sp. ET6]|uniref:serine hydrolase domain-containing protein n=1 Tax=Jeotgalibacillus sp. ET6 TaxID=3037260 RepID=UPI0024185138|nr:serine hydrolase domain-containing protein [Jeotgalibacillus sp. ET6]MDG5472402.1 serine hydrolase [Jeotgalibacillus sp. ET6]
MRNREKVLQEIEEKMKKWKVPGLSISAFTGNDFWQAQLGVREAGGEPVEAQDLFHACSISKFITAAAIMRLVQQGVVQLERPVNDYLVSYKIPDHEWTDAQTVTLQNLLAHQAGFIDSPGSYEPIQSGEQVPGNLDLLSGKTPYHAKPAAVSYEPETQFSYSDTGYAVAEQVITDVTGQPISSAITSLVLEPVGMENTFLWSAMPTELPMASGHHKTGKVVEGKRAVYPNESGAGIWTSSEDLGKLCIELTKAWSGSSDVFSQASARKMLSSFGCEPAAGLGVFRADCENGVQIVSNGWGVGFQCQVRFNPEKQTGIVVMVNQDPGVSQPESIVGECMRIVEESLIN